MGTVNIAAFIVKENAGIPVAEGIPLLSENVTSSGTSAQSSAMPASTEVVRVATDTTIRVLIGENPTALSTSVRLLADTAEYFTIRTGHKVAVIDE